MKIKTLIVATASLAFATACDTNDDTLPAFGAPRATVLVQGYVVDKDSNPIPGIEVGNRYFDTNTRTGEDGSYEIGSVIFSLTAYLQFADTDGEENGGAFKSGGLNVTFTEADRVKQGNGALDRGSFAKSGVNVMLERVKEPEPPEEGEEE